MDCLAKSLPGSGSDSFITMSLEEALLEELGSYGAPRSLILIYESFAHAFCRVLERDMDEIKAQLTPEFLKKTGRGNGSRGFGNERVTSLTLT